MNTWLLLLVSLAVSPLRAQLQISIVTGSTERPVNGLLPIGNAATGQPLDVLIRIKNTATSLATITTFDIQGSGYSLVSAPAPPVSLVAGYTLDFYVRFLSDQPVADARANLHINSATITFLASAVAAPNFYYVADDGSRVRRLEGQSTVFTPVDKGARSSRRFVIENPFRDPITITRLSVTGDSFQLSTPIPSPWQLVPNSSNEIEVVFQPATSGLKVGALTLDQRGFPLEGVGREPTSPKPLLSVGPEAQQSGKQVHVSVNFDATARSDGAGLLRLDFQPDLIGPDDPAIAFVTTRSRSIPFQVKPGESQALFANQTETIFQTGTTAGTLRLTAEMGGFSSAAAFVIPPAPILVDTVAVQRQTDLLDLTVKGFDNSRSANSVAFWFYDASGIPVAPGELRSDVTNGFSRYFETATAGGMFALRAVFPATGITTAIAAVEIEFRNKTGAQRTPRITF